MEAKLNFDLWSIFRLHGFILTFCLCHFDVYFEISARISLRKTIFEILSLVGFGVFDELTCFSQIPLQKKFTSI